MLETEPMCMYFLRLKKMLPNIAISDQLYGKEQPLAFKVCVNQKASLISGNDVSVK